MLSQNVNWIGPINGTKHYVRNQTKACMTIKLSVFDPQKKKYVYFNKITN